MDVTTETSAGIEALLEEYATSAPAIEQQARVRYGSTDSYQGALQIRYQDLHHWYAPVNGDQWPKDAIMRPGKIHVTANVCRPIVEIDARLQSILPRFTIPIAQLGPKERKRAEATEYLMMRWLKMSGIEVWLNDLCRVKSIYGKGILKPYWDDRLKRGDVSIVENPANLRLGWGSNDYTRLDWAIYEYSLSAHEILQRWPEVSIVPGADRAGPPGIVVAGRHADPLDQRGNDEFWRTRYRQYSEYERAQLKVWDYWYKDRDGTVLNAIMVAGIIVDGPHKHSHLPDIPYIVIENDHEPGSPEGMSSIESIVDLQEELNRLMSHGLQFVADNVDVAWYATGPSADAIDPGVIPKPGEVTSLGENRLEAVPKGSTLFPIAEMMGQVWTYIRRETGISDIAFGDLPGADTAGRALAIQVEAMQHRLDPRRRRLYRGLRELLVFWTIMAERKDPRIPVEDETGETLDASVADLVRGFYDWEITAPEITPRDNFEVTNNEINKVNARLSSLRSAMDAIGVEAPEAELVQVAREHNDIDLHPESVQVKTAIMSMLQQLQAQQQQLAQMMGQQSPPGGLVAQAQGATAQAGQAQQAAQPAGFEDQNQLPPQPITQQGTAPPQGAGAQAGQSSTLIRGGQPLNQIAFR